MRNRGYTYSNISDIIEKYRQRLLEMDKKLREDTKKEKRNEYEAAMRNVMSSVPNVD